MKHYRKKSHYKKYSKKARIIQNIQNKSKKFLPKINQGLQTVGSTVRSAAVKSGPVLEKGISNIYGVLATGFNKSIDNISSFRRNRKRYSKTHKKRV
jgi:hypothetical protein